MADQKAMNNSTGIPMTWVDNGDGTYSPKVSAGGGVAPPATRAGVTLNGSRDNSSGVIVPAGTFVNEMTIQNTHASQTLSITFTSPATSADFTIQPGAALTMKFGPTNALYGIGSGAATTFACIGS